MLSYFENNCKIDLTKNINLSKCVVFEMIIEFIFPTDQGVIRKKYILEKTMGNMKMMYYVRGLFLNLA